MLEAVVGAALRAVLESVILGGLLALCVALAMRGRTLAASTRHLVWTSALIAIGAMPFAGFGVSLARAHDAAPTTSSPAPAHVVHAAQHTAALLPASTLHVVAAPHAVAAAHHVGAAAAGTKTLRSAVPEAPGLALPGAVLSWTPHLSRSVAVGALAVWLGGAAIGLAGLLAGILRVRGLKRRSSPLDGELSDELPWLTAAGPGREIYLRLSFEAETPVAIGFRRPVILIPTELATAGGLAAIEPLVLHEHAHLRRYDDWTNLVQRTIERLFWFNPVVWLIGRRIALERELASDDAVVEKTGQPHAYAASLWRLAREMRMPEHAAVAPGALLTRRQISVRIEQLLANDRGHLRRSMWAGLGTAFAGACAVVIVAAAAPAIELPTRDAHSWAMMTGHPHAPASATKPVHARAPALARRERPVAAQRSQPTRAAVPTQVALERYIVVEKRLPVSAPPAHAASRHEVASSSLHRAGTARTGLRTVTVTEEPAGAMRMRLARAGEAGPAFPADAPAPSAGGEGAPPDSSARLTVTVPIPADLRPPLPPGASGTVPRTVVRIFSAARVRGGTDAIADVTSDAARSVRDALAQVPVEIGTEIALASKARSLRFVPRHLTRETIAGCAGCVLRNADLHGLDLHGLTLDALDLSGANLRGVDLSNARINGGSLVAANLTNADLRGARIVGSDLRGAVLDNALLEDVQFSSVRWQHVSLHGTIVRYAIASCESCDFSYLNLRGQDLHGITVQGSSLSHADLRDANLAGVRFVGVDLSHAHAAGADLSGARLEHCNVADLELRGARTTGLVVQTGGSDG